MAAGFIELGTDRQLPDIDAAPPPPRRRNMAAAIALTVLLAVGASAAPGGPGLRGPAIVRSAIADRSVVLADRVYVMSAGTGQRRLSTFALPTGHHLWTVPFAADGQPAQVLEAGQTVLVSTYEPHLGRGKVFAFDRARGWPLWQRDTWMADVVDDGSALIYLRGIGGRPPFTVTEVSAVDGRTGRTRWTVTIPGSSRFERVSTGDGKRWGVVMPVRGAEAEVWDLRTGTVAARGPVVPAGATLLDLVAVGGMLLSRYTVRGAAAHRIAAYTVDDLALQWVVRAPSSRDFYPVDCGALVCVGAEGAVTALDPRSGAVAWRAPYHEISGTGERLFAHGRDGELAVLASDSGRSVRILPGWEVLGPLGRDNRRQVVARSVPGTSRIWVGVLDVGEAVVHPLGLASGVLSSSCRTGAGSVVCELIRGGVGVWTIRL